MGRSADVPQFLSSHKTRLSLKVEGEADSNLIANQKMGRLFTIKSEVIPGQQPGSGNFEMGRFRSDHGQSGNKAA
jgi:hypothetical protein